MFSPIRKAYEMKNQSPALNGLFDLQIVLLSCGLEHLDKSLRAGSLKLILNFGSGNRVAQSPQRTHESRWAASDAEMENRRTSMSCEL